MAAEKLNAQFLKEKYDFDLVSETDVFSKDLYRYIPISRLEEMLNKMELVFVYPSLWDDPFEILYLKTDYSDFGYKQNKVYCLCGRNSKDNEDALWKVYAKGDEPLVRVKFDVKTLFSKIRDFAKENGCKVYCAKICYNLSANQIKQIQKITDLTKIYLQGFDEKKYISLLSLKREAFAYEKEWRLFIVPQQNPQLYLNKDLIRVPIEEKVFKEFVISPMDRIKTEGKKNLWTKINRAMYDIEVEMIKKFIQDIIPKVRSVRSGQNTDTKPIGKIKK